MKKVDIINEYNSLTSTLINELESYEELTGNVWQGSQRTGNMNSSDMMQYKDDLERRLCARKSTIYSIREAKEVFLNTMKMKESEEGRDFIANLETRRQELLDERKTIGGNFVSSFNELLDAIGLGEWELKVWNNHLILPTFSYNNFEITHKMVKGARLWVEINRRNRWEVRTNSSVKGPVDITDTMDSQYLQFKAYVTFCEKSSDVMEWVKNIHEDYARQAYDNNEEIEKIDADLDNPYEAYMRTK